MLITLIYIIVIYFYVCLMNFILSRGIGPLIKLSNRIRFNLKFELKSQDMTRK